jgi:hypothetical protein
MTVGLIATIEKRSLSRSWARAREGMRGGPTVIDDRGDGGGENDSLDAASGGCREGVFRALDRRFDDLPLRIFGVELDRGRDVAQIPTVAEGPLQTCRVQKLGLDDLEAVVRREARGQFA